MKLQEYLNNIFQHRDTDVDEDLLKVLRQQINRIYGENATIKDLFFVETGSHTMFFTSREPNGKEKLNSLYNAPLNSKIFAFNNNSSISLSLTCSKIKVNNPSTVSHIEIYDELIRILPASKKNDFVLTSSKITNQKLAVIRRLAEEARNRYVTEGKYIGTAPPANSSPYSSVKNKESFRNSFKNPSENAAEMNDLLIKSLSESVQREELIDLTDQANFVQSQLINRTYISHIPHYFLCLEKVVLELIIKKISDSKSIMSLIFSDKKVLKSVLNSINYDLFVKVDKSSLVVFSNEELLNLETTKLVELLNKGLIYPNTRFNLFLLYIYGILPLGGRFQVRYMKEFTELMLKALLKLKKLRLSNVQSQELHKVVNLVSNFYMFDMTSMIIIGSGSNNYCRYKNLLNYPINIDSKISKILALSIKEIESTSLEYLNYK